MGRMGRTQPRGIAGHHGTTAALIFRVSPACVSATLPDQPAKSDTASPEKARARAKKDFSEALRRTVAIDGEPVAIVACLL